MLWQLLTDAKVQKRCDQLIILLNETAGCDDSSLSHLLITLDRQIIQIIDMTASKSSVQNIAGQDEELPRSCSGNPSKSFSLLSNCAIPTRAARANIFQQSQGELWSLLDPK